MQHSKNAAQAIDKYSPTKQPWKPSQTQTHTQKKKNKKKKEMKEGKKQFLEYLCVFTILTCFYFSPILSKYLCNLLTIVL